jgi:sulfite reductase (ferredoxin)
MTPTYTMLFAGSAGEQGELGRVIMRVPAKRVIDTVLKIIELYRQHRSGSETLHQWVTAVTKGAGSMKLDEVKNALEEVVKLPLPEIDPDAYMDYGSDSRFIAKTAKGECAA